MKKKILQKEKKNGWKFFFFNLEIFSWATRHGDSHNFSCTINSEINKSIKLILEPNKNFLDRKRFSRISKEFSYLMRHSREISPKKYFLGWKKFVMNIEKKKKFLLGITKLRGIFFSKKHIGLDYLKKKIKKKSKIFFFKTNKFKTPQSKNSENSNESSPDPGTQYSGK